MKRTILVTTIALGVLAALLVGTMVAQPQRAQLEQVDRPDESGKKW